MRKKLALLAIALVGTGCALGPDYQRPELDVPEQYGALEQVHEGWQPALPGALPDRTRWWTDYADERLTELIRQLDEANPELAGAEARHRQARALLGAARSDWLPSLDAEVSYSRSGTGGGRDRFVGDSTRRSGSRYDASLGLSWELDLWGRVRRQVEARRAELAASEADLAAARLSLQATLAESYFQLRILDEQRRLYEQTLTAWQRSLELTENQYRAGLAARSDVVQARTQLESTRAQAIELQWQRAQLEHAIAILVGQAPAHFELEPEPLALKLPALPQAVPAELLLRRPDIAASERAVAAANAGIGIAQTAWLPRLTLTARGGYQHSARSDWLTAPNRYWSLGPSLATLLFDGGQRRADKDHALASYDASVARYRETVLNGFREVEDALARLQSLTAEAEVREQAVALAEEAERLMENRYRAGLVSYLNVANAQTVTLDNRRRLLSLRGEQLAASARLVVALGGDWSPLLPEDSEP